jgi:hypothetical protein
MSRFTGSNDFINHGGNTRGIDIQGSDLGTLV